MGKLLNMILVFLGMAGIADAGYITYEEFAGIVPNCSTVPGFDCGAVLRSEWSHIGPVPLALLGLLFYICVVILSSYLLVVEKPHPWAFIKLQLLAVAGFLFSLFLVFLQAVIIQAFCLYCMISATTSTLIFITTFVWWWKRSHDSSAL